MSKTLKIFAYNGSVGAESDIENGTFINDIESEGQLGVVVSVNDTVITSEALNIMKTNYKREGGSFAPVMIIRTDSDSASNCIALMGFGKHGVAIKEPVFFSRDCDLTVLDEIEIDDAIEIPDDFKAFIDSE